MKKQIFWIKCCALLLTVMLIVHSLEIVYDIVYHRGNGSFFNTNEMHFLHDHPNDFDSNDEKDGN